MYVLYVSRCLIAAGIEICSNAALTENADRLKAPFLSGVMQTPFLLHLGEPRSQAVYDLVHETNIYIFNQVFPSEKL